MDDISFKRQIFQEKLDKLINQRHKFSGSILFSHRLSELYTNEIISIIDDEMNGIAIVATGSFARHELSPYSDCDIMFISESPELHKDLISKVITSLWDRGIKVSQTVRDIKQIQEIAENDLISFCQFLEIRFLIGSKVTTNKFKTEINKILKSSLNSALLQFLISDIEKRHLISSNSPFLLEPNIKQNPGGLRDFQSSYWLDCVIEKNVELIDSYEPFAEKFLNKLLNFGNITLAEYHSLLIAFETLLKIRNEMHILSKTKLDRFDFQLQMKVSENFAYLFDASKDIRKMVMEKYFFSAEQIFNLVHYTQKRAISKIYPIDHYEKFELDDDFVLQGRFLTIKNKAPININKILKAYLYRENYSAFFSDSLKNNIINSLKNYDGLESLDTEVSNTFREILKSSDELGEVLKHMNRTGVLGYLIPEFGDLKNYFQPNAYHIYTADEHTIIAISNLCSLKFEDNLLGEIFRKYDNIEPLIISILCHDIAKPHTLEGHEFLGSQICESIMERLGCDDKQIELSSFLVKNHLVMEQVAFRRNIHDVETLNSFRNHFDDIRHLDFLYLLTFSDLSAVNPSSWTSWKNSLLDELYYLTSKMIIQDLDAENILSNQQNDKIDYANLLVRKEDYIEHIESINDPFYVYTFDEEEIAGHIKEIRDGKELSIFTKRDNNFTKLTLITYDQKSLLANICGAISISDVNIHDAKIFTRKDNVVIDNFFICNFPDNRPLTQEKIDLLSENLTLSIFNKLDLKIAFEEHKNKWKRIDKKLKTTDFLEIEFEEHLHYSIIDIHTADRIGLLYVITKKLSELELNIYFSKIGTKLNGVFDSFYVLDKTNRKIHRSQYSKIKEQIAQVISEI